MPDLSKGIRKIFTSKWPTPVADNFLLPEGGRLWGHQLYCVLKHRNCFIWVVFFLKVAGPRAGLKPGPLDNDSNALPTPSRHLPQGIGQSLMYTQAVLLTVQPHSSLSTSHPSIKIIRIFVTNCLQSKTRLRVQLLQMGEPVPFFANHLWSTQRVFKSFYQIKN